MIDKINWVLEGEILIRLLISMLLGCLIGHERKNKDKDAGMRTHAIVCLGSAIFMVISKYGFGDTGHFDSSRIASQVVTGIGFLGAGVIFIRENVVSGLTTAAGIWAASGVGLAIGAGMYISGITTGFLILIIQALLPNIPMLATDPIKAKLNISVFSETYEEFFYELLEYLRDEKIRVDSVNVEKKKPFVEINMNVQYPHGFNKEFLISNLSGDSRIRKISG